VGKFKERELGADEMRGLILKFILNEQGGIMCTVLICTM
jgi:hypothetical protein